MKKSIILITLLSAGICNAKPEIVDSQFLGFDFDGTSEKAAFGGPSPIGSGFNYQGELIDAGSPANGNYDFSFQLYDANSGGSQVGSNEIKGNRPVVNGLFSIEDIDFGDASYTGDEVWLSVTVRETGDPGSETTLTPRQKLHSVPYAVQAEFGAGSSLWTENGSDINYTTGQVGIGGNIAGAIDFFIDSDTGSSPFLARINNIPKLRVDANGGTSIGFILEVPPEDGLLVVGPAIVGRNSNETVTSGNGLLSIGDSAGDHITFDGDDIQARNGAANNADSLYLNFYGGDVVIGNNNDEVRMNTDVDLVNNEINASASGDADMKAYLYGRVSSTGTITTSQSSSGFTVTKTSTGLYKVNISDGTINTGYMVVSNTNSSSPKFTSNVIGTDGFDVHVWNTSGAHTDHSFTFVVYRK